MTVVVGILGAREGLLKVIRQIREGETFLNGHCLFKGEGVDPCPVDLVLFYRTMCT